MGATGRPGERTAGHRTETRKELAEAALQKPQTLIQNPQEKKRADSQDAH